MSVEPAAQESVEIPASTSKRPRKAPFAGLAAKLGIDPHTLGSGPRAEGEPYVSHSDLLERCGWPHRNPVEPCGGTMRIEDRQDRIWTVVCDACGFDCTIPGDATAQASWRVARASLPAVFADKLFDPTPESQECRDALRGWVEQDVDELIPGPALYGRPGRGKTHLLTLACKWLISNHGVQVFFTTMPSLLDRLQAAMKTPEYNRIWDRAVMADVLALDDLGAELGSDWRADRVAALIDERYRMAGPIALTTNVRPELWEEAFDARTFSRLRGMCFPLELCGVDRRQTTNEGSSSHG